MPITDPYKKHIDPSSIGGNNPTYLTLVSKDFVNDLIEKRVDKILDKMYVAKLADSNSKRVFKNGTIFIPQKHHLELIDTDRFYMDINSVEHKPSLQDYMIEQDDLACVIPDIKYLNKIKQFEWEFINKTTGEVVHLPSIKEPMVASQLKNGLKPGYYSVKFRYKLSTYSNEVHEVMRDCAFIIKK